MRTLFWCAAVATLGLFGACTCGGVGSGRPCSGPGECPPGEQCIAGRCEAPDGGAGDGGEGMPDGSVPDGGPGDGGPAGCVRDADCGGGRCLGGSCCAAAAVCGDLCCDLDGGAQCFAGACVVPGEDCTTHADCGENAYCERGLADTGKADGGAMGGDGGVCLGETPSPGRCLAYPPDCSDPEADPNTCILSECEYVPNFDRLNATVQWRWGAAHDPPEPEEVPAVAFPDKVDVWSTPAVGRIYDTNCDGVVDRHDPPAVVFVSGDAKSSYCSDSAVDSCRSGVLRALDGASGTELWSVDAAEPGSSGFAGVSVALADVDGVPGMEVIALTGEGKVAVYGGDGRLLGLSAETVDLQVARARSFGWGGALAVADMEGDGVLDVAYGYEVFRIVDGVPERRFTGSGGRGKRISTFADLDGDGTLELVAGRTAYEPDGTVLWQQDGIADGFPAVADFDGDGAPEVVVVQNGMLWILAGADGSIRWGPLTLGGTGSGGPPTVADFDGDGRPEIGVAQADYYSLVDVEVGGSPVLSIKWTAPTHDYSSSVTGSTVFDFEGDGRAEVVYNDECFLWVYDGTDGSVRFIGSTTSFTANEASLVADVDGDGHAEIVMISNGANPGPLTGSDKWHCRHHQPGGMPGPGHGPLPPEAVWEPGPALLETYRGITVWRDRENTWVGTRALWNQHTYHVTNICSERDSACEPPGVEGAVPRAERPNWSVPWLNNFRQNVQEAGLFDAPDAVLTLAAVCEAPLKLIANVRNRGRAPLPDGVRIGFYVREAGGERKLGEATTTRPIYPGQVEAVEFRVPPMPIDAAFFARIEIDPNARTFRECDESNNESNDVWPTCIG